MSILFSSDKAHLIAEIGVNHEGDIERARSQIRLAVEGGADSVKLQYYNAKLLASELAEAYWDQSSEPEQSQGELFKKYDSFGVQEIADLSEFTRALGSRFGLSIFHLGAAEEVAPFVDYFKVASGDITFHALLREMITFGKPIVVSTGASMEDEVAQVVQLLADCPDVEAAFLQCTLSYPTRIENANILSIDTLKVVVGGAPIGVSDHIPDRGNLRFQLAFALGARVFEKHFSDTPGEPGNDHYHSWGPEEFRMLRRSLVEAESILGSPALFLDAELPARQGARRSLFFATDLKKGHRLTRDDVIALRPATGIPASDLDHYVGKVLTSDAGGRTLVSPAMFED